MTYADYLRRQAETLTHLSRATFDLTVAGRLRSLAAEFRAKAAEMQEDPASLSALALRTEARAGGERDLR